jgi:hypothetical protein
MKGGGKARAAGGGRHPGTFHGQTVDKRAEYKRTASQRRRSSIRDGRRHNFSICYSVLNYMYSTGHERHLDGPPSHIALLVESARVNTSK